MEENAKPELEERLKIYEERLAFIGDEKLVKKPFTEFFSLEADFLLYIIKLYKSIHEVSVFETPMEELRERNLRLYKELFRENYKACPGNPDYACATYGEEYGALFAALYNELRGTISFAYEDLLWDLTVCIELFLEVYGVFADEKTPPASVLKNIISSYNHDYCAKFTKNRTARKLDAGYDFAIKLITGADLNDLRYLYAFGAYVSENELKTAKYLNSLSENEIDDMASVFVKGYKLGFAATGKDISKKKTVSIEYALGFERLVKSAIAQFRAIGLEPVIYTAPAHCADKGGARNGLIGTDPNPQFTFDHIEDEAIYTDERYIREKLSALRLSLEGLKNEACAYAGPAVIETFGKTSFSPEIKKTALKLSEEQQELKKRYLSEAAQIRDRYIKSDETSYTIIAYPIPEIGEHFEEIFAETAKLNSLDYDLYRNAQQRIIDELDKGHKVIVEGRGENETNITVMLHELGDPEKQTNFENCVADVNIPVGEVFTSPVLKGTCGRLHVSRVYIKGMCFKDLKIEIKDGIVVGYSCANYEDPEDGKKLIKEYILCRHESLPMGEFAIGTNLAAYRMAEKYDIADKLPILIAEKTAPHFAFGDTCYSREEEVPTYNPDGKEIIAKENEFSRKRKEAPSAAYFNCHTDVTIPLEELGSVTSVSKDGEKRYIIKDGIFVVDGAEFLNL